MSATPCPRLFEVEALRDGRLTGAQRARFERHVTGCPACSSEVRALEALAESLRAEFPDPTVADEVRARRERTRLMAAFDRALLAPEPSRNVRHWLLWPAAVSALVIAILLVLPRVRRPAEPPTHPLSAVVHADSTSVWSERRDGDCENLVLERGALWIHVNHSSGEGRLLVVLPDGELEDIGTTFTVSADDGHTTRVAVQEGHVVLRIRGQAAIALGPGDSWMPDPRPAASVRASAPAADPAPSARLDAPERSTPPTLPPSARAASPTASSSSDFRAAMAALDVGDNHQAAAAFATFLAKHPRDPRAEDAAYLRIIALQRSADSTGMKQAAVEYLRRYPAGFRQAEVEPLSR